MAGKKPDRRELREQVTAAYNYLIFDGFKEAKVVHLLRSDFDISDSAARLRVKKAQALRADIPPDEELLEDLKVKLTNKMNALFKVTTSTAAQVSLDYARTLKDWFVRDTRKREPIEIIFREPVKEDKEE